MSVVGMCEKLLTPYLCPAIRKTTLVYCVPPLLNHAWFSMAHDLMARRFQWRSQLLTRVSSPPVWRGFHAACAVMSLPHLETGQRRVYYVCHTSGHLAFVPWYQSGATARLQHSPW